jgi:error-prone DNA polymerase
MDRKTNILQKRFLRPVPDVAQYKERLQQEFDLIERFQFTQVFLQVQKIIELIKDLKIPHIIRGSSGSSLTCFLLGITDIDPILYGLELARFMNSGRKDLPDIDIDVPYNRRPELYAAIHATWPGAVARISNHVKYGAKTALREVAKDTLKESMPSNPELRDEDERKALQQLNRRYFKLDKLIPDEEVRNEIKQVAAKKVGTLKNYSLHCGGIVIFEDEGKVPENLLLDGTEDQIKLNKDETEDAGFIKIDILSNRGLAQLVESAVMAPKELLAYPDRDPATEKLLASGNNFGITFAESRGMRKILVELRPRHREDIAIALALVRPAAAAGGRKASFLERWKFGAEDTVDPLYKPIVFDDDAIGRIKTVLGCDVAEADKWRKAFAKGNPRARVEFRQKVMTRGFPRPLVDSLVDDLSQLILYSFCKSHAVSYAQLVWALTYEKAHNPYRFWVAALNHCHSEFRKWVHWREARTAGLVLTREKGHKYVLSSRGGKPAIVAKDAQGNTIPEQTRIDIAILSQADRDLLDYKQLGYWLGESFLQGCGLWPIQDPKQPTLERWFGAGATKPRDQEKVRFRGLIASARCIRRSGKELTFLCIGVDNQRYIDITILDRARTDLFSWAAVEGVGLYTKEGPIETILVDKIHGVALADVITKLS